MGFFNHFFYTREIEEKATTAPAKKVSSGSYINNLVRADRPNTAMKVAAVYRAVYLISTGIACLNLQYKRKNRAGDFFLLNEKGDGKEINYLLSVRPNNRMNSFVFMRNLISQVLLTGNAVVIPVRSGLTITSLILASPGSVDYDKDNNTYDIHDDINLINKKFKAEEIIHIKNTCIDGGFWGISTIEFAATTLGIAATADKETWKRFGTGGRFKAILTNDTTSKGFAYYDDNEMSGMADDIQESLNLGDDIIQVKGDAKLSPLSMSSADMQFLDSRKFGIREIARFFNVPPTKLMDDSNSNYKSTEMSNIQFYVEALQPLVTEIEREFNAKLLTSSSFLDYKYQFDLSALYALDLDAKAKWNKARLENGQASVNDLRREADKEPVAGGDDIYMSCNVAPLGSEKLNGKSPTPTKTEGGTE